MLMCLSEEMRNSTMALLGILQKLEFNMPLLIEIFLAVHFLEGAINDERRRLESFMVPYLSNSFFFGVGQKFHI